MSAVGWIPAHFGAPDGVFAGVSTRQGGVSQGGLGELNLAGHVGDDPARVAENRARLSAVLALPSEPLWLQQVHGVSVHVDVDGSAPTEPCDAAVTFHANRVLAVLTADCLPVVLVSRDGRRLGVAHAGWRGLANGVIEATIAALGGNGDDLVAWLGPAISPDAFEVGDEVRTVFAQIHPSDAEAFTANARGRWQADLSQLASRRLARCGVSHVTDSQLCTYADAARFYSHRRDPASGRLATLVWRRA
jgi:YfiH family protein